MTAPAAPPDRPYGAGRAGELIADITSNPLYPGYYDPRHPPPPPGPRRVASSLAVILVVLVLGSVVGAGIDQLRTSPARLQSREVLEEQVEARNAVVDQLTAENAAMRAEVERLEADQLQDRSSAFLDAVDRLGVAAGAVAITGPGVRITLDDPPSSDDPLADTGDEQQRVLDLDVQLVANSLWASGAEAIAINGTRLTSLSPIRHAGSAILVDNRPLARPYVVEAVGDADAMSAGPVGSYLAGLRRDYGIQVAMDVVRELTVPASGSGLEPELAHPYPRTDGTATP